MRYTKQGFTLVELLVVIGIVSVLVIILAPTVRQASLTAKENAVRGNCANIEVALASYAQNHEGNYPGVAIDIMAPWEWHALGDGELYAQGALDYPAQWDVANGILGGYGHRNNSAVPVHEQIANARATQLVAGNVDYERYFDSLIVDDALSEYPVNVFSGAAGVGTRRMQNVFGFTTSPDVIDLEDVVSLNAELNPFLLASIEGDPSGAAGPSITVGADSITGTTVLRHDSEALPIGAITPAVFSQNCKWGVDDGDYFSPGDFAYIPIVTASAYPDVDNLVTLRNEFYQWGTNVTGYMIFGFGSQESAQSDRYATERTEFIQTGIPDMGAAGIDTRFELYVLQLFEGAVYFNKTF
ncbi:MAG: type II secretion system protein [Planctomycetales bacterium]|nr:type II secretion system protein [bacterium]UNM08915.1 MAG: type II secretion system protein [Planctomycetales bacterium]